MSSQPDLNAIRRAHKAGGKSVSQRARELAPTTAPSMSRTTHVDTDVDFVVVAAMLAFAITVLVPFLLGHFVMTHTFVLKKDPAVYVDGVRGIWDHFLPTYLAGLVPIAVLSGAILVLRQPWRGRKGWVLCGFVVLVATLFVLIPSTIDKWQNAEQMTAAKLRETAFPYAERYIDCASWALHAENGAHQSEIWSVNLGLARGTQVDGCNLVAVYRGWQLVGEYTLPEGGVFTDDIEVNHVGWDAPVRNSGGSEIWQEHRATGARTPMNPRATNIHLPTKDGRALDFNLDGAGSDQFDFR